MRTARGRGSQLLTIFRVHSHVLVVGGSLVGLSTAASLAHRGATVTVLERTAHTRYEGGGGLGVDVDLLTDVTGLTGGPPVCKGIDRATTAWSLLAEWLETNARTVPGVDVRRGVEVGEVGDGWVRAADGRRFDADLVIGADDARSTARRWVSPEQPDAVYAGVLLWRAMVDEHDLPEGVPELPPREPSREYYSGPYRLVTYPVPGADGSAQPGRRRLNLVWYDPARSDLLADNGLLEGTTIHGSLLAVDVPRPLREELRAMATQRWPSPWREALGIALERGLIFGTPVVHSWPNRMVRGRVALAGDAAHAASPMVGGGFREGLSDVAALSARIEVGRVLQIAELLEAYERQRLGAARAHVRHSQVATQRYLERRGFR
jgi:2-polyprenyl-6-methoxyphenol hydroxylase-like FAD-dependent oxidoreductase